jgi:hypothetical protein
MRISTSEEDDAERVVSGPTMDIDFGLIAATCGPSGRGVK